MEKNVKALRSDLGKVRGLGAAKDGTHHWLVQRVTAVALIPLSIWFAVIVFQLTGTMQGKGIMLLRNPLNVLVTILFLTTSLYHGALGMQVIIEDYVHCRAMRIWFLLSIKFISIVTAVAGVAWLGMTYIELAL